MSINFMGSYSGIDSSMVDQLMAIEKRPVIQMAEKKVNIEGQKNSWNDVRTRLNNLFEKIKVLNNSETYSKMKATEGISAGITTSKNTPEGTYEIKVAQLATRGSVIGGVIGASEGSSIKELALSGDLKINGNEIAIEETDSIRTIADKINSSSEESGVRASIIDNRIVLNNVDTGKTEIKVESDTGGLLDDIGMGDTSQATEGKNALFSVNGVEVERSSNSVTNVIEYTTIKLNSVHDAGKYDSIVVSKDTDTTKDAIKGFVAQYNSTMSFIKDQMKSGVPGDGGSGRGILANDSSLQRLQSSLRALVTSSMGNEGDGVKNLSQIGVTTVDRYGQLSIDESKLDDALKENEGAVKNFFDRKDIDGKDVGFVGNMTKYIDSFSSSTGMIKGKTDSFDRSIKDIGRQLETFNARMVRKEKYYMDMFSKLDSVMMEAESQMSWLSSQMSSMTGSMGKK